MLRLYSISCLEGKVSEGILSAYAKDCHNIQITSIIAGFHRTFGLRDEGIRMSLDIVDHIRDDPESMKERGILLWNLYVLCSEFTEEGMYDKALAMIHRAECNWSRDAVLGDDIGVYHVSWLEQFWQRKADIYFLIGDHPRFLQMSDQILSSRIDFFNKAEEITGETILGDRLVYHCLSLMSFEQKKHGMQRAIDLIKDAIRIRSGKDDSDDTPAERKTLDRKEDPGLYKRYLAYVKYYYTLYEHPYDNVRYTYCSSCRYYEQQDCSLKNMKVDEFKCCSKYRN